MAGDTYIQQTENITRTTKKVENEIKNTVNNINVDLSKLDMTRALDSFKRLEEVSKAANFDVFIGKILSLKDAFANFQTAVKTANSSVTTFSKSADKISGGNVAVVTNVDFDLSDAGSQIGEITSGVSSAATEIGSSFSSMGSCALDFGSGIAMAADSVSGLIGNVANLFGSVQSLGDGIVAAATGVAMLIPLLPALGTSILQMAVNMAGIVEYIPQLLIFMGILLALSLLGEGLTAAGNGLVNIGLGLTSMTAGMAALMTFMPVFISSLAGITDNVGGIVLFVLLAAAMLVMAIALQTMNEQMTTFVQNMQSLSGMLSVGFVAAFVVFGTVLVLMSLFMGKVADGMDKVTSAMEKQAAKLAILNPLLAAQAILTNPIIGIITVAAAVAGGLLVKGLLPAMATGGVVSSPTVTMVGEGRYPEAVVPLGDSPQFAGMKTDIANAVVQGISALGNRSVGKVNSPIEIVLNLDGEKFARAVIPQIDREHRRRGYTLVLKEV